MNKNDYLHLKNSTKHLEAQDGIALMFIVLNLSLISLGIYFSIQNEMTFYLLGQLLLVIGIFQAQILVHELGHGHFFSKKKTNMIIGELVSLIPIIPFGPWVLIHGQHHRLTGNKYLDPTMIPREYNDIPKTQKMIINFCWKFHIPIFSLGYSFGNFWNLKKLKKLYPLQMNRFRFSIILSIVFYLLLMMIFQKDFFKVWTPAYFIFLAISEPLLFSQHVHVDQGEKKDQQFTKDKTYALWDQDQFTRTLRFPAFLSYYFLVGFNLHTAHHLLPDLPGYHLHKIKLKPEIEMNGFEWYQKTLPIDGATLLFQTKKDTGLL
jgi:fatty acid desaturase